MLNKEKFDLENENRVQPSLQRHSIANTEMIYKCHPCPVLAIALTVSEILVFTMSYL